MQPLIDVCGDWETFYDSDYTLKTLTVPEYVLDPRFEAIGISLKLPGSPAKWYTGSHAYIHSVLAKIPWHRVRFIAHNAVFDGSILEWKFGFQPAAYLCTMMGSRPYVQPYAGSMALHAVGNYLQLPLTKGDEVIAAQGMRRIDFDAAHMIRYGRYACNDNEMCNLIKERLDGWLPDDEKLLLDLTIKKFVRPRLELDLGVVEARLADIETKRTMIEGKAKLLGCPPTSLRSRDKFAKSLEKYGISPLTKVSARTGLPTYAFAKDDEQMIDLLIHPDLRVRTLVEAKIFASSTMETKRLERFRTLHGLDVGGRRKLPVPLLYYGAHTGRLSGYDKINLQNLTRVSRDKVTGEVVAGHLRFALKAPPGYSIVAADLSNIEARIVATLAKCYHLVQAFRDKRDIYCEFATRIYGRTVTKANEVERFVGKTCILGLGYGMGAPKFSTQLKKVRVKMSDEMTRRVVYLYRDTYREIPQLWADLENMVHHCAARGGFHSWGPLTFAHERIMLPNGMSIIYPGLHVSRSTGRLTFNAMRGKSRVATPTGLWGGGVTENVVQALAKIVISTAEVKLARLGLRTVLQVHDELVYCVPTANVNLITQAIDAVLCEQVPWLPDLPVACEIKHGPSYGDAK